MKGIVLAREWLLLGAESFLAVPTNQVADVHQGFGTHGDRWADLGRRLRAAAEQPDGVEARLRGKLGLGEIEYWLVMLAAAIELHPEAAAAASILAEDERLALLTPSSAARLARAALGIEFEAALRETLAQGRARRLGLLEAVEVVPGRPTTQQGLRLRQDELAALLAGGDELGAPRALVVTSVAPGRQAIHAPRAVAGAAQLAAGRPFIVLRGASSRSNRQFALDLSSARGQHALFISVGETLPDLGDIGRLRGAGVAVLDFGGWPSEKPFPLSFVNAAADLLSPLVVMVGLQASTGTIPTLPVPALGREHARRVWSEVLDAPTASQDVTWLSDRFRVSVEEARLALEESRDRATVDGEEGPPSRDCVAAALLAQGSRRMGRAVTSLCLRARLADLVVPPALERQVREVIDWYAASARVEREYGLRDTLPGGPGLACLFSGPSGTGKTFAAQCIANEIGLNLYRIDLSQVVSKYIGETEKALAQIFDEAEAGHGVLLFDEADALFGKRTEVKDAHDRYANVEVGYLLQRLESFSGIAILTTNLRSNIDGAFVRRLRFVFEFPMPDVERRERLWERALPPPHLRHKDLDLRPFVQRFKLSGGHIHSIGLAASHLAAATPDGLLGPEHLVQGTFRELEKAGMARSASDFGPLADWLPSAREAS